MSKFLVALLVVLAPGALAQQVSLINPEGAQFKASTLNALKKSGVDFSQYSEIRIKAISGQAKAYLISKKFHRLETFNFDQKGNLAAPIQSHAVYTPHCPDTSVDFIAFAPNNNAFELQITEGVAKDAETHGYKVVRLYKTAATAHAYLDYMSCTGVRGNFYDGDANPEEIVTADGSIMATEFAQSLRGALHYMQVNIWLACEAFNNPMRSVMIDTIQSQKYAAGYNDLQVGPSDNTAACAMKAALNGEPMTQAFATCRKQLDIQADSWGFDGHGSEYLGH